MNRRKDKKLLQIAFDDLKQEALSASEHETVDKYRVLKKDLESLREIPDHQLSNERLRTAILGQGLKPSKEAKSADNSWFLAMGGSAALIAIFFVGTRLHHPVTPPVVEAAGNGQLAVNDDDFDLSFPKVNPVDVALGTFAKADFSADRSDGHSMTARHLVHHPRRRMPERDPNDVYPTMLTSSLENPGSELNDNQQAHPTSHTPDATKAPASGSQLDKVSTSPESKDIEIDQDKDQETGARSAREINKNVAVGG